LENVRAKAKISLLIGCAILLFSCIKDDDFDAVPSIDFKEYTVYVNSLNSVDSALFKFSFTDGDGDLGSLNSDEFNCFLIYEEMHGDSIVGFPEIPPREYSLPNLTPSARDKNIEGSISLILKPVPIFNISTDSIYRYTCYVIDRKGNKSNTITSGWNEKSN
tara:strand:+ start:980 stop:1465 length:486 start_codon:yes stop_codon:yes gene_type:complete